MPALSPAEVAHLARLSRLDLTDDELNRFGAQLDVILGAVAAVADVAAADVPPTTHAVPMVNVTRADVARTGLSQTEALAAAPAAEDGRFRVPRILDEDEQ
jgi:aspartyl-tRNA(Asn)/glutamyl-tRNA(Gln) amidotransferase subunit C